MRAEIKKTLGTIAIFSGLAVAPLHAFADTFVWDNSTGFQEANQCSTVYELTNPYRVIQYSGPEDNKPVENIRTQAGAIKYYIFIGSLVKLNPAPEKEEYEHIKVVGINPNSKVRTNRYFAQRLHEGYVHLKSLLEVGDHVFEIQKFSEKLKGKFKEAEKGMFLQAERDERGYAFLRCSGTEELVPVFQVFKAGQEKSIGRVGVSLDHTSLLADIRTLTPEQAEKVVRKKVEVSKDSASTPTEKGTSAAPLVSQSNQNNTPQSQVAPAQVTPAESSTAKSTGVAKNESAGSRLKTFEYRSEEYVGAGLEEITLEDESEEDADIEDEAMEGDEESFDEEEEEEVDGAFELVACMADKDDSLAVRSDSLDQVTFRLENGAAVKVFQDFDGGAVRTQEIDGVKYEFVKIQTVQSNRIGWVAKSFIKQRSECESLESDLPEEGNTGAQISIGAMSPGEYNVCTQSGSALSTYDTDFKKLKSNEFIESGEKVTVIDGILHEMPKPNGYKYVQVKTADGKTRIVAKDFLSTKACAKVNEASAQESGKVSKGYVFPVFTSTGYSYIPANKRPKQDSRYTSYAGYRSNWGVFGASRSGGRRAHAANDLYQPKGLKRPSSTYSVKYFGGAFRAMHAGKIVRGPTFFYLDTYYIAVHHDDGVVTRYGEIYPNVMVKSGRVKVGQTLGYIKWVGQSKVPPMLHLEHYKAGNAAVKRGDLKGNKRINGRNSQRSNMLFDRTDFMKKLEASSL